MRKKKGNKDVKGKEKGKTTREDRRAVKGKSAENQIKAKEQTSREPQSEPALS